MNKPFEVCLPSVLPKAAVAVQGKGRWQTGIEARSFLTVHLTEKGKKTEQ